MSGSPVVLPYHWVLLCCREHPEVSEALCVEMMTRQLGDEQQNMTRKVVLNQILVCLAPWMQNIILNARWESEHFF